MSEELSDSSAEGTDGLTESQERFLRDLFPGGQALFRREQTWIYGTDAGRFYSPPWAVVRPSGLEQVRELLRWAQAEQVPLFPRARGTNVVGGCVPRGGGVVISTLAMENILELDARDFVAVVQPGVSSASLRDRAQEAGLFYPPDPASIGISSIGGNAATNAGGMRAVKYGVTGDYVLGCEAVLPGGKVIRSGGRVHKDVVGLDLTSLLVGSEGTLALMTELTLKLLPLPEASASLLAGFGSQTSGLEAVRKVFGSGLLPAAVEFMDRQAVQCLRSANVYEMPGDTDFLLLFKLDGSRSCLESDIETLRQILLEHEPKMLLAGKTPREEEELWEARRALNPASFQLGPDKLSLDVTVPRGSIGRAVDLAQEAGGRNGIHTVTFGHLGDGNIHVNFIYHAERGEADMARRAASDLVQGVMRLRGTISGEHGVGLAKLPYAKQQLGRDQTGIMREIKRVFDPQGILNPGKGY
ncbi:MAG: FAD-binding protein [Desulfohalobiaceae bacterium]|nr:FAD-binding protein [Desulfohalobiaceae bacterium]